MVSQVYVCQKLLNYTRFQHVLFIVYLELNNTIDLNIYSSKEVELMAAGHMKR